MEPESTGKNKKLLAIVGLIVIVAAIAAGATIFSSRKTADTPTARVASPLPTASPLDANPTATPASTTAASDYNNGNYKASASYHSPGGEETVNLNVTLSNGVVSDSSVTTTGHNPTGKTYQGMFIANYKSFVTGKNIDDIKLSKVSGSSLTSGGFNSALEQIKSQAKS